MRGAGYMFESGARSDDAKRRTLPCVWNLFWRVALTCLALLLAISLAVESVCALEQLGPPMAGVIGHLSQVAGIVSFLVSQTVSSRIRRLEDFANRAAAGDFYFHSYATTAMTNSLNFLGALDRGAVAQLGADHTQPHRTREQSLQGHPRQHGGGASRVIDGGQRELLTAIRLQFEQILELPAGSSTKKKIVEAVRQAELVAAVRQVLPGGDQVTGEVEVGTVRPRSFSVTAAPVHAAGAVSAVLVLHDITELRRLERVRRDFVANVSHEFKTPLTAIQGFAETLLGGALDDKRQSSADSRRSFATTSAPPGAAH